MANNFIYREAAPGQQAVQYAQLQEQGEADRRRIIAQTYHDMSTQGTEMARTNAQIAATRSQMNQRSAEAKLDRDLQREGYKSAEAVAAGKTKATEDAWDRMAKAQTDAEAAEVKRQARALFQAGFSDAAMMNDPKVPQAVKDKISLGRNVRPSPDGKTWVNAHADPDLPEKGMQTIDDLNAAEAARNAGIRASVQPGAAGDKTGGWGKRTSDIEDWKNRTSPVAPRTSTGRDGWHSAPPPDPVVPPAPFSNTGRLRMGDDNLESPLRSYDFNSQTNGYREFFPPDYSWPPVSNDVRANSFGPHPVIDPQDGIRQNQMMQRAADLVPMRPPSTSGFNPPRAGEFYYPMADGTWRTGTNYPPIAADDPYISTDAPPRMRETLPPVHPDSRLQYEILKGSFRPY